MHKNAGTDDKKLQTTLKKMNVQPIQAIEEVNMFKSDGNVIHFSAPKGTFCASLIIRHPSVYGHTSQQPDQGPPRLVAAHKHAKLNSTDMDQSTPRLRPTPSPSTATVRTRS